MHRRFNHLGPEKIRNLYKVITLFKSIKIPKQFPLCHIYLLSKMKNKIRKELSLRKDCLFALIQFDIAGPLPRSIRGNRYFLLIVDNWSNEEWFIPLKHKSDAPAELAKWKMVVELRTDLKVRAARSDNAPELIQAVEDWESGVQHQTTTIASSHQNGKIERNIQTAEADIRAMLTESKMPIEFWDEAGEYDVYVRNRTMAGPIVEGVVVSPEEAFTGETPSIDHLRVWGSLCFSYVNPKTIPAGNRHDKLVNTGRQGVFMGFSADTTKHYKAYSPDLGYVHRVNVMKIDETIRGGTIDLRIRNANIEPQGTENVQPDRKGRGRPRKMEQTATIMPETIPKTQGNIKPIVELPEFTPPANIPSFDEDADGNIISVTPAATLSHPTPPIQDVVKLPYEATQDANTPSAMQPVQPTTPTTILSPIQRAISTATSLPMPDDGISDEIIKTDDDDELMKDVDVDIDMTEKPKIFAHKREWFGNEEENEHQAKRVRAMIAMILSGDPNKEATEHAMIGTAILPIIDTYTKVRLNEEMLALFTSNFEHPDNIALPATEILGIPIPKTYKQAMNDPKYAKEWKEAIEAEIQALIANGTWKELIPPPGTNMVSTKWVFTVKTLHGKIERFKARLVARGFTQKYGIDYTETFAPTVRIDTLRIFFAIVAKLNLECSHFDIKNAFTESHLKEEIWFSTPDGVKVKKGYALRALRSLYGLKQAGRDWNLLLKKELLHMGFKQSLADPCLYTHRHKKIWLLVYVDDILAALPSQKEIQWFDESLKKPFNAVNLGEAKKVLGMRVTRDRKNRTLYLDQEEYIDRVLNQYGFTHEKHQSVRIPVSDYNNLRPIKEGDTLINVHEYQQAIGSLMHCMVYTRPDIAFAVGRLAQFMTKPAEHHGHALKQLMRYLRQTYKAKLRYGPGGDFDKNFVVYTDADWASDKSDRKSISGGVVMFYGGPISYASKKQNSVATSSAESEYISVAMFVKQGRWMAQILKDLGVPQFISENNNTVSVLGDNQGAIALTKNPHLHERSKHIDICYHFVRDLVDKGDIDINYINTVEMVADGLTKPLARVSYERWVKMLGMIDMDKKVKGRKSKSTRD